MQLSKRLARSRRRIFLLSLTILAIDQFSKAWAISFLERRDPIELIGGMLTFNHTTNSGAAFNIGADLTIFLTVFAIIVTSGLIVFARKVVDTRWSFGFGILLGGVLGNLSDRIFREPRFLHGHVVDFIQLPNWPIFNVADIAITTSGFFIAYLLFKDVQPFARFTDHPSDGHSGPSHEQRQEEVNGHGDER